MTKITIEKYGNYIMINKYNQIDYEWTRKKENKTKKKYTSHGKK